MSRLPGWITDFTGENISLDREKTIGKKTYLVSAIALALLLTSGIWYVIRRTEDRVQIEFNIHINKKACYLTSYSEPPQFAIWLENQSNKDIHPVFVTYRTGRGDWEGKSDVPAALPRWNSVSCENNKITREDEIAISGATPKADFFRVRAEVRPGSEWICWIEMNLAGDYNKFYPQFNKVTLQEDEYACGQPALLYQDTIVAREGLEYNPQTISLSIWNNGTNDLIPFDSTITTAQNIFDEISVEILKPKPKIVDLKKVEQQEILKTGNEKIKTR